MDRSVPEPGRNSSALRDNGIRPATNAGLARPSNRELTLHGTLSVPFALQMEDEEQPNLSSFKDPIRFSAKIVWLNADLAPGWRRDRESAGSTSPSSRSPGEFQTADSLLDDSTCL